MSGGDSTQKRKTSSSIRPQNSSSKDASSKETKSSVTDGSSISSSSNLPSTSSLSQKPDFQKLISLVHSPHIQTCNESAAALREMLLNGDASLLCGLLSQYVLTSSEKLLEIIAAVRQPLDTILLDQLTEIWRVHPHACVSIVSQLILKQVPWLYRFLQHPCFVQFLKTMRTNEGSNDLAYTISATLILASLVLLSAPVINHNLSDIFNAFIYLTGLLQKRMAAVAGDEETPIIGISLLHFRFALYSLFQRLYGLFPCHFLTFLRQNFAGPQTTAENRVLYQEIIRPMLDVVKLHPLLVTANKEGELAKERWVKKEIHDIMAECNRVAGDPYENGGQPYYFQGGMMRHPSSSNFLSWSGGAGGGGSLTSRPTSTLTLFSGKPTPIKDGATPKPSPLQQIGRNNGGSDLAEKRQISLAPITLPSGSSSNASIAGQKSSGNQQQQQTTSYWSPSDAVGLSTPPEDGISNDVVGSPLLPHQLRMKHFSERSKQPYHPHQHQQQTVGGPLRKTSMAAGPETPAPHMRSFRTGSWGAEARQKFLQNRQQQQQNQLLLKQHQSASGLLEETSASTSTMERKSSTMSRRSFGQAFAKLFNRPGDRGGTSSVPPSPSVGRQPDGSSSFDFDFGPAEYRAMASSSSAATRPSYRDNGSLLGQQPELAEEADEACASGAGSTAPSRNGAGSLASSKRPSLSEPVLFPPIVHQPPDQVQLQQPTTISDQKGAATSSDILKTLNKENDENLLDDDEEMQKYWANVARNYTANMQKRLSFSSSRTSSSAVINAAGDRTRHSSSATGGTSMLAHGGLSRHSSLLDTQAVAAGLNEHRSASSMTPPISKTTSKTAISGDGNGDGAGGGRPAGFTVGAPDDTEEEEDVMEEEEDESIRLRSSTNATDISDNCAAGSSGEDGGGVPRLSTSQSLADFMSRMNRIRFNSRCMPTGDETTPSESPDLAAAMASSIEQLPNIVIQQQQQQAAFPSATIAVAPPPPLDSAVVFRRRGSTFSGVLPRPLSCPPNANAALINATVDGARRKQNSVAERPILADHLIAEKESIQTEESRLYDALLMLTRQQGIGQPTIPVRPSPYQLLDEYMAATGGCCSASEDRSWPSVGGNEPKDDTPSSLDKAGQSPDLHNNRKASSSVQRKSSSMHAVNRESKEIAALKLELQNQRAESSLWKQRVFYERHQRILHAERNRRLYGRLKQATALDEQNQAQHDQMRLQETEIRQLTAALTDLRRQLITQRQEYATKEFQLTTRLQAVQREAETAKGSHVASKRMSDDLTVENNRLRKDLGGYVQRLFDKEAAYAQLQEQCAHDLPTKQNIAQLNKELFLMSELNRQLRQRTKNAKLRHDEFERVREQLRTYESTAKQETSAYRRLARQERHKSEAAVQRNQELETQLQKKQAQTAESKRRLDQTSEIHQEQLAACQMKYAALMTACQRQEAHILELYEKMEAKYVDGERRKSGLRSSINNDTGANVASASASAAAGCSGAGVVGELLFDGGEDEDDGDGEDEPDTIGVGLDIPLRTGTASEIRSYDSYHSASYVSQHQQHHIPGIMSASVASIGSDLYLPYLFNPEFPSAIRGDRGEMEDDGVGNTD